MQKIIGSLIVLLTIFGLVAISESLTKIMVEMDGSNVVKSVKIVELATTNGTGPIKRL